MENIAILAQLIIAISIVVVWVFRFDNIVVEFKQYGLSPLIRSMVGASKIALSSQKATWNIESICSDAMSSPTAVFRKCIQ